MSVNRTLSLISRQSNMFIHGMGNQIKIDLVRQYGFYFYFVFKNVCLCEKCKMKHENKQKINRPTRPLLQVISFSFNFILGYFPNKRFLFDTETSGFWNSLLTRRRLLISFVSNERRLFTFYLNFISLH